MRIIKVLRPVKYGAEDEYVSVPVQLDDGTEGFVYVGGEVHEPIYHNNRIKVHVKRNRGLTSVSNKRTLEDK